MLKLISGHVRTIQHCRKQTTATLTSISCGTLMRQSERARRPMGMVLGSRLNLLYVIGV